MKNTKNQSIALPLVFVCLWLISLVSALGVTYSTYQSRKATQVLEELRREASGLQIISGQYLLEKNSWAAYSRVERVAHNELKMKVPIPEQTILIYRQ